MIHNGAWYNLPVLGAFCAPQPDGLIPLSPKYRPLSPIPAKNLYFQKLKDNINDIQRELYKKMLRFSGRNYLGGGPKFMIHVEFLMFHAADGFLGKKGDRLASKPALEGRFLLRNVKKREVASPLRGAVRFTSYPKGIARRSRG